MNLGCTIPVRKRVYFSTILQFNTIKAKFDIYMRAKITAEIQEFFFYHKVPLSVSFSLSASHLRSAVLQIPLILFLVSDYSTSKLKGGRRGGLMVSALVSGSSGPVSSPGREHCVVFLGKTLYSHGASLHPGV